MSLRNEDCEESTAAWTEMGTSPSGPLQCRTRSVRWLEMDGRLRLLVREERIEVKKPPLSVRHKLVDISTSVCLEEGPVLEVLIISQIVDGSEIQIFPLNC